MERYQHNCGLRNVGIFLQIASIIYNRYLTNKDKVTIISNVEAAEILQISPQNLWNHCSRKKNKEWLDQLGLSIIKAKNGRKFFKLDVSQYKQYILGVR